MRLATLASLILLGAAPAARGHAAEVLTGTYALPDGQPKVTATLAASPGGPRTMLDIAMTAIGAKEPIKRYETELSKRIHVIGVSADLRDFVHEHGNAPGKDGHFRLSMTFPHAGLWHVYADSVPQGLGQQVMRFDVVLGRSAPAASPATPTPTGLTAMDGPYAVRFDGFDLKAGQEARLSLRLLRDGKPAGDVTPFLGVAAHAVFIDAADLSYVHVHAAPAEAPAGGGTGPPVRHDAAGTRDMHGMAGMGPPLAVGSKVPPDLALHVRAPKSGIYVLWIQFDGGGRVRTTRFVARVG